MIRPFCISETTVHFHIPAICCLLTDRALIAKVVFKERHATYKLQFEICSVQVMQGFFLFYFYIFLEFAFMLVSVKTVKSCLHMLSEIWSVNLKSLEFDSSELISPVN